VNKKTKNETKKKNKKEKQQQEHKRKTEKDKAKLCYVTAVCFFVARFKEQSSTGTAVGCKLGLFVCCAEIGMGQTAQITDTRAPEKTVDRGHCRQHVTEKEFCLFCYIDDNKVVFLCFES
jgi:predicted ATP-dependent protease